MNSLIIYLTLLLCTLNFQIHCSYPLTTEGDNIPIPPRLSFTSTVVYNDIIYSYGGISQFTGSKGTDKMFSYTMNSLTGEMVVRLEDEGHGPICSSCSAVLFPDSTEILVFSRPNYNETSVFFHNQTMWQPHQILLPHFYDLVKRSWRVAPPPQMIGQEDTFYFRNFPTTVMNGNDGVYILGGYNTSHTYMRNGFYYNRNDNSYTTISLPNNDSYVSAIGYIGLDGNLALLGGCNQSKGSIIDYCYHLSRINIYDNVTRTWGSKEATLTPNRYPLKLAGATTQVDYKRKLLYVAGGYYTRAYHQKRFSGFLFLDLEKNMWILGSPDRNSENQISNIYSSGELIMNNSYFVRSFGKTRIKNKNAASNNVDILDLKFSTSFTNQTYEDQLQPIKWITSILEENDSPSKNKKSLYIALICSLVVALAVALLLYYRRRSLPKYWNGFRRVLLWNPRKGEPISTEISRLLVKIISLAILVSFLVYNINDVLTSTISSSLSLEGVELVTIPDFRICYSGWDFDSKENPLKPGCNYLGDKVNSTCPLDLLESFYYVPHYESQTELATKCYMFAPKDPVFVDSENETLMIKTKGYTYNGDEVIYMQLYRKEENINRIIFNNESLPGITKDDVQNWSSNETQDGLHFNAFPDSFTTIEYQETDYQKIRKDSKWNYFGAYPDFDKSTKLSIDASQPLIPNDIERNESKQYFYNIFTLVPKDFTKTTITEKRDSTLLHVLGSIGGVISLLFALQIILFGSRPSSPWGIFHYWTWKKKSTPPGLGEQFRIEEAQVPFINPVHQRFNDIFKNNSDDVDLMNVSSSSSKPLVEKEDMETRMSRLEARNQLLELVMKNYYLDDQVFLALKHAQRTSEEDPKPEKNNSNNHDSDDEDSNRELEYKKLSFRSDTPIIDAYTPIYSNR